MLTRNLPTVMTCFSSSFNSTTDELRSYLLFHDTEWNSDVCRRFVPIADSVTRVVLPSLEELSVFIDRVKASSDAVSFTANRSTSVFTLSASSLLMSNTMYYRQVEVVQGEAAPSGDLTVTVDIRKIAKFLSVKEVNPARIVVHLVESRALVLSSYALGDTNLVFYIPALCRV
jgi:hypothetical protein